jgi:hypothetical protein
LKLFEAQESDFLTEISKKTFFCNVNCKKLLIIGQKLIEELFRKIKKIQTFLIKISGLFSLKVELFEPEVKCGKSDNKA